MIVLCNKDGWFLKPTLYLAVHPSDNQCVIPKITENPYFNRQLIEANIRDFQKSFLKLSLTGDAEDSTLSNSWYLF